MSFDRDSDEEFERFQTDSDSDYETVEMLNRGVFEDPRKRLEEQIEDAVKYGRLTELDQALTDNKVGINVNTRLTGGWSALMYAAYASEFEVVEYLIKHKADVNQDANRMTPLMCACSSNSGSVLRNFSTVKRLIDAKAKVNMVDNNRLTALMRAIEGGKVEVAKLLIPHANLELTDSAGKTAVFYAVIHKQVEILEFLIQKGASLDKEDYRKNNIKKIAQSTNHEPILNILQKYLPEKHLEAEEFIVETLADWKEMFPGILPSNKPAFWYEITALLHGMHCEKALKPLKDANVNLAQFLSLTNDEMLELNIALPYLRKRLKAGLYKFHLHKWNMSTVLGYSSSLDKNTDYEMCLDYFGSHLKHLTVMKSTYAYINKSIKTGPISFSPEMVPKIDSMITQISNMEIELRKFREIILPVNKLNPIPADLITKPKKTYISKKKLFYVTVFSAAAIITVMKTAKTFHFKIIF